MTQIRPHAHNKQRKSIPPPTRKTQLTSEAILHPQGPSQDSRRLAPGQRDFRIGWIYGLFGCLILILNAQVHLLSAHFTLSQNRPFFRSATVWSSLFAPPLPPPPPAPNSDRMFLSHVLKTIASEGPPRTHLVPIHAGGSADDPDCALSWCFRVTLFRVKIRKMTFNVCPPSSSQNNPGKRMWRCAARLELFQVLMSFFSGKHLRKQTSDQRLYPRSG